MKHRTVFNTTLLVAVFASGATLALAQESSTLVTPTPVGPVTATITQLNYETVGGTVDGFLVGNNVLLAFAKPVCGGIGTLGAVGNSVTYSGTGFTFASGIQTVLVTSYTDGTTKYPPSTTASKPTAYPLTAGTIKQLNYNPEGGINGFVFTPTSGTTVLVEIGYVNSTLMPLLKAGTAISVMGTLEGTPACAPPTGTLPEVFASSVTINGTSYPLGGIGHLIGTGMLPSPVFGGR